MGDGAHHRRAARRPVGRVGARGVRDLVWRDVQPYQGHPLCRRHDRRRLRPRASRARTAAPALASGGAVWRPLRLRSRDSRAGPVPFRLCVAGRRDLCADRRGRSVAASGWLCGPLRGPAGGGIPYCLRDHDRGVAVGRPGAAQSAARAVRVRRVSLSDQHDPRRPRVPDGRRSALVRAHLYRHQAHADCCSPARVSRSCWRSFRDTRRTRQTTRNGSGRRRCSWPSPRSSR